MYNNLVLESMDNRTNNPQNTQYSKESMYYEETETNSYSFEEVK